MNLDVLQAGNNAQEAICDPQKEEQIPQEALQDAQESLQQSTQASLAHQNPG